jgi:hypothetical protein
MNQIRKRREYIAIKRAMDAIRRVTMQINQCNRKTGMEEQILRYQCNLTIQVLKINKPAEYFKLSKKIMETIENTYKE